MKYLLLCVISLCSLTGLVSAGGCYMPRVSMQGTATTKQAVYMRSMPCMEEGSTVVTARKGEVLSILQESDGWYQLQREDGTVGWIYYTWLSQIDASELLPPDPYATLGTKLKNTLGTLADKLVALRSTQPDTYAQILKRIDTLLSSLSGKQKLMILYIKERLNK